MEILFFLVGVCILGLGVYLIYDHLNYVRIAMETTGKVIGFKVSQGSKGKMYKPVVESYFGEFTSNYGSSRPSHKIGERVEVLYVAGKEPRIKSKSPYILGIFFMFFGGIFCLIFLSVFRFTTWHFLSYGAVLVFLGIVIRRKLKEHGIDSLDELKEKAIMNQSHVEDSEKKVVKDDTEIQKLIAKQQKGVKYIGQIFAIAGIGVVGLGIYLGIERYKFLKQAIPASGEVIDFHESRSDDSYTYYPIVEYSPSGSFEAITFRHDIGSNPPSYQRGEIVPVLHLPDNLQEAIIDKGIFNWAVALSVTFFGLLFALVGIGVMITVFKRKKDSSNLLM